MKKVFTLLMCIMLFFTMVLTANAASELSDARNYKIGSSKSGSIVDGNENDVYTFELNTSGKLDIKFSGNMERARMNLYDETGKEIWNDSAGWNSTTQLISYKNSLYLCKGDYYLSISKYYGYGDYEFTLDFTAVYESFAEEQNGSDNSVKTANKISHGNKYTGCIAINDEVDIYDLSLAQSGKLDIKFSGNMERARLKLYDETGNEIWNDSAGWNSTTELISYQNTLFLCKGQYYMSVSKYYGYGEYELTLLFSDANESFSEPQNGNNNKVNEANIINVNQKYNGLIALNDEVDIYRITINSSNISLNVSGNIERVRLKLYDENGKEIWNDSAGWNSTTQLISYSKDIKAASGLYYLSISKYYGYGNYSFYFSDGGYVADMTTTNTEISVKLNGIKIMFDQPPVLENGRTLVPLRAIFEALGANVDWVDSTQTVIATKGGTTISLTIGSNRMYVNGTEKILDVPAKLINSRTLVPVRAISEAFGCNVDWDGNTQTVIINN